MTSLLICSSTVPTAVTIVFCLLLVGLITCLALEEQLHAKKSIIAGAFAVVCLLLGTLTGILPFDDVVVGSKEAAVSGDVEIKLTDPVAENNPGGLSHHDDRHSKPDEAAPADPHSIPPSEKPGTDDPDVELHVGGHEIRMPVYIPGIDWSVIAIILGSSLFVDVTSRSGLFSWIAIKATKLSLGDPRQLLILYGIMTVVFSAVLNNVTAMIIVGSLTAVSLEKLDRKEYMLPFLLVEGLLTNIGGLLTLISSVPNIIVGTTANISFATFLIKAAPYVVVSTGVTLWLGAWVFKIRPNRNAEEKTRARDLVNGFDENDGIESPTFFRVAIAMLAIFIVLIAGTSALPVINKLGMGFVALSMAAVMLLMYRSEVDKFYRAVDWDLIGFFMALFVVIYVMEHANVLHWIGLALQSVISNVTSEVATAGDATTLLLGSAAFSSVTDNIPLSAMLASILHDLNAPNSSGLWWSVIFGSNLGGNLTPIGSASTLVAVTIMHKHGLNMTFAKFVQMAFLFAVVQILLAILYVIFVIPLLPG